MIATAFPYVAGMLVLGIGLYGAITSRHLVHLVLCVAVAQSGTYLLLLAIGYRFGGSPPVFTSGPPSTVPAVDPIVQALALTDVVVSATTSALLFALAMRLYERTGSMDPAEMHATPDP